MAGEKRKVDVTITNAEWKEYIALRDQRIWIRTVLGRMIEGPNLGSDGNPMTGEKLLEEFKRVAKDIMERTAPWLLMLVPAGLLIAGGI